VIVHIISINRELAFIPVYVLESHCCINHCIFPTKDPSFKNWLDDIDESTLLFVSELLATGYRHIYIYKCPLSIDISVATHDSGIKVDSIHINPPLLIKDQSILVKSLTGQAAENKLNKSTNKREI
jgi:hypothetical protein